MFRNLPIKAWLAQYRSELQLPLRLFVVSSATAWLGLALLRTDEPWHAWLVVGSLLMVLLSADPQPKAMALYSAALLTGIHCGHSQQLPALETCSDSDSWLLEAQVRSVTRLMPPESPGNPQKSRLTLRARGLRCPTSSAIHSYVHQQGDWRVLWTGPLHEGLNLGEVGLFPVSVLPSKPPATPWEWGATIQAALQATSNMRVRSQGLALKIRDSPFTATLDRRLTALRRRALNHWAPTDFHQTHTTALRTLWFLGLKHWISATARSDWSATGLAHLLAISGLHIGFLAACSTWFIGRLLPLCLNGAAETWSARATSAWISSGLMWSFVMWVGCPTSAVRAAGLIQAVLLGHGLGRPHQSRACLYIAGSMMLFVDATLLCTAAFWLSFLGCWVLTDALDTQCTDQNPSSVFTLALVSLRTACITAPVILLYFGSIAVWSPLNNFFIVPLVVGLLFPAWVLVSCLGLYFLELNRWAFWGEDVITQGIQALPNTQIWIAYEHRAWMAALWLGCVGIVCLSTQAQHREHRPLHTLGRWLALWVFALIVAATFPSLQRWLQKPTLRIHQVDVGQADGMLIELPNQQAWLVDVPGPAGSSQRSYAAEALIQLLHARGRDSVDVLVLTHADHDHSGGAKTWLSRVATARLWTTQSVYTKLFSQNESQPVHLPEVRIFSGQENVSFEDIQIRTWAATQGSENDRSLVLEIRWHERSVLLTGDIETPTETRMLAADWPQPIEVLKLAHHGSGTSTSPQMLKALDPLFAFASYAPNHRFNFPNPQTLRTLRLHHTIFASPELCGGFSLRADRHGWVSRPLDPNHRREKKRIRFWGLATCTFH